MSRRSDLYSLGLILYELVTGERAYGAASDLEYMVQHVTSPPLMPSERFPDLKITEGVEEILRQALATDPDDRYQTVSEMREHVCSVRQRLERGIEKPAVSKPSPQRNQFGTHASAGEGLG